MAGCQLRIRGLVQGVGFRPYVWRLATELGLVGWVRNEGAGVRLAVNGKNVPEFERRLPLELPRLARIDGIDREAVEVNGEGFAIIDSAADAVATAIGPDSAICPDCVADICDPEGRRWRYPFTTCTHCGPRYTVSRGIPYDRARTSLAAFPLCPPCATEYGSPSDRRFHAETSACPSCGPRLQLLDAAGQALPGDPLGETLRLLIAGQIVSIKGLGGFHLACDARNPDAVAELRERKQREQKPFAVMGLNVASLANHARLGSAEAKCLHDTAAPIVLCPKAGAELVGVAPGLAWLGVMVPATPLHLLLWHEGAGRPAGTDWLAGHSDLLLVMTSANPHGEPLVIGNTEALERLSGIADAYLVHDREILVRCDDSVLRAGPSGPTFIRRARGFVPVPVPLADDGPNVLALGGYLKNTVAVFKGREAYLSQHIGGLENASAIGFLEETVAHLLAILEVKPDLIAHDLHPDYPSTRIALELAEKLGVQSFAVPHHQAHIAAICAEHGVNEPILGFALDGVGLGPDGAAWGGELLRLDGAQCQRLGHLSPLGLAGGDRAAREPWRMALSALHAAGLGYRAAGWLNQYYPERDCGPLLTMLERGLRCPPTTSLGRWFDAAAGLLGVCEIAGFEGQAPMMLESLAEAHGLVEPLKDGYRLTSGGLDLMPLVPALLVCHDAGRGAALFHATVAAGLAEWAISALRGQNLAVDGKNEAKIAISGGCAMNGVLMAALRRHLSAAGVVLLEAVRVPPNDGGLALGQGWLVRKMFEEVKHVSGDSGPGR